MHTQAVRQAHLLVHRVLLDAEGGTQLAQLNAQRVALSDGALVLAAALDQELVLDVHLQTGRRMGAQGGAAHGAPSARKLGGRLDQRTGL